MKIIKKRWCEWDYWTKALLTRATFPDGYLKHFMGAFPDSPTIVLWSNSGQLIGWAGILLADRRVFVNIFIRRRFRRRGMASRLIVEALKDYSIIHLTAWDDVTDHFFNRLSQDYPGRIIVSDWSDEEEFFDQLLNREQKPFNV